MERLSALLALLAAFSVGTAHAQLNVLGELAYDLPASPGQLIERSFEVENLGEEPVTARLYQTDYSFAADGSNAFGAPGSVSRSNASWVTYEPSVVVIGPGLRETVRFRVQVPSALPEGHEAGSFWSMLMIEGVPKDDGAAPAEGQIGVRQITRFGVQIATHLGQGTPSIEFTNGGLEATDDGPVLRIDVINTGDVFLRPGVTLRIVDDTGREIGSYSSDPKRLYPGTSVRHVVRLRGAAPGSYSAILIADAGDENVFGASLNLTL